MNDTALQQLAEWAAGLKLEDVPSRIREHAVNQVLSIVSAVYCGWESDLGDSLNRVFPAPSPGPARILPTGVATTPVHAAMLMAAWSMVLDFDDVMLGGHTGHSSVLTPLALSAGHSGGDLLLAQIVANEIAARINMTCAVGSTRGQMATHVHLLAACSARAKLEGMNADAFANALGFALSYPARALYPAFLGSDAKTLSAAWPIRIGFESVEAVRAGLAACKDVLDDSRGFFASAARVPVREFLGGLGERWHTETSSYKIYPVCGYLCSALDATLDLVHTENFSASEVVSVDVWSSLFVVGMDAHSAPYLDGAESRISTLTFSTPFTVASALLARQFGTEQLRRQWIREPEVWRLASRVRSRHDLKLTREALIADIPIGAAMRRLPRWQAALFGWSLAGTAFGGEGRWRHLGETVRLIAALATSAGETAPLDFRTSTKPMGARVDIRLSDGRLLSRSVSIPRGFAGADTRDPTERPRELMKRKFVKAAARVIGPERAAEGCRMIENMEDLSSEGVVQLLDVICKVPAQREGLQLHSRVGVGS
jgi:2-methylcitrate dehydratase PrpD